MEHYPTHNSHGVPHQSQFVRHKKNQGVRGYITRLENSTDPDEALIYIDIVMGGAVGLNMTEFNEKWICENE